MQQSLKFIVIKGLLILSGPFVFSQTFAQDFLTPSDTLRKDRSNGVLIAHVAGTATAFTLLATTWYADHERGNFHFQSDADHWKQVDKAGHAFGAYQLARNSGDLWQWAGVSQNSSKYYAAGFSFVAMSAIEVADGFSKKWGASVTDLAANAAGSGLYLAQEMLWKEQRIQLKYSFHYTAYADVNPNLLGESSHEQWLKDYNGQTYWLSVNPSSFGLGAPWPEWLNIAFGYGANGMLQGKEGFTNLIFLPDNESHRQYYLSLDVDLTKIRTQSALLKTVFSVVNTLKVPMPTLEIQGGGRVKGHWIYF